MLERGYYVCEFVGKIDGEMGDRASFLRVRIWYLMMAVTT